MPPNGFTIGSSTRNVAIAADGKSRKTSRSVVTSIVFPLRYEDGSSESFDSSSALQYLRRSRDRSSQCGDLLLSQGGIPSVDGLVHSGNHHGGLTRIHSRRVDRMVIPGTVRQPLGNQ